MTAIVISLISGGAASQAALVDFYFTGATTDPTGRTAAGHLLYDTGNNSISDLMFWIGGEPVVNYSRGFIAGAPELLTLPGERQLLLNEQWVAGGRSLFFLSDLAQAQVFFDNGVSQAGIGKWSDVAVVPEPSTIYAGLMLLLPIGWSAIRRLRTSARNSSATPKS